MIFRIVEASPAVRVLMRVSVMRRTVRYEWQQNGMTHYGPTFRATLQEWERAL